LQKLVLRPLNIVGFA